MKTQFSLEVALTTLLRPCELLIHTLGFVYTLASFTSVLAGPDGFEPPMSESKSDALTTWLRSIMVAGTGLEPVNKGYEPFELPVTLSGDIRLVFPSSQQLSSSCSFSRSYSKDRSVII